MIQSNREFRSGLESTYLALAAIPLLLLGLLLGFGMLRERVARAEVNAVMTEFNEEVSQIATEGRPIDNHSMAQWFDARTSPKNAADWRDVFAATRDVEARFGSLVFAVEGLDSLVPPDEAWDAEPLANRYVKEAQPIIETIARLVEDPQPVGQPLMFAGFGTLLGDLQESRGTLRLLEKEFQVAVHAGDEARALRALELMRGVERAFDWRIGLISEMVVGSHRTRAYDLVRRSLRYEFWSDSSLKQLRQWLELPIDYDTRWQAAIDSELAMGIADMESPEVIAGQAGFNLYPFGISAHARLRYMNVLNRQRNVLGAGSQQHVISVGRIDDQLHEHTSPDSFTITGIPFANTKFAAAIYQPVHVAAAAAFARWEAERKWTLTAAAIREFHLDNDRWPNELSELTKVGLAPGNWTAVGSQPFGYRVVEDGSEALLWTAQLGSWSSGGSVTEFPPTEAELEPGTLDAVLLKLRVE